jgi:hypothetical protein
MNTSNLQLPLPGLVNPCPEDPLTAPYLLNHHRAVRGAGVGEADVAQYAHEYTGTAQVLLKARPGGSSGAGRPVSKVKFVDIILMQESS